MYFLFFKQQTAYGLRISDWSSDVCSSDLGPMAAWSDGIEVHAAEQEGRDIRLDVLLQAALLAAGSLDAAIALRLIGRPAAARRYLAVEARRAIGRAAGKLPSRLIHDSA